MAKRLPRTILIDGETWTIYHWKRKPKWVGKAQKGRRDYGCIDVDERRIWIKKTGNIEVDIEHLMHECDHAINWLACLRDPVLRRKLTDDVEERLVTSRQKILWHYARDNDFDFTRARREPDDDESRPSKKALQIKPRGISSTGVKDV